MGKLGAGVTEQAIGLLINAPRPGTYGGKIVGKTKRERIYDPLSKVTKTIRRGAKRKKGGKDANRTALKQARILPARILFGNLSIDSKTYFED